MATVETASSEKLRESGDTHDGMAEQLGYVIAADHDCHVKMLRGLAAPYSVSADSPI